MESVSEEVLDAPAAAPQSLDVCEFVLYPYPTESSSTSDSGTHSPPNLSPPQTLHKRVKRSSPSPSRSPPQVTGALPHVGGVPTIRSPLQLDAGTASSELSRPRSRTSSVGSRSRSPPRVASGSPLVVDTQLSKTRLVIRKTVVVWNSPLVPMDQSVIIGFNVTFHTPPSASARVKDTKIELNFYGSGEMEPAPIIKAISPQGTTTLGQTTQINHSSSLTGNISLGYDPFGKLGISVTRGTQFKEITAAHLVVSGIETSKAWITLTEDPSTENGIPASFDFALLLHLPSAHTAAFEVDLSAEASIGFGFETGVRKLLGAPRLWRLLYDGTTSMGQLELVRGATVTPGGEIVTSTPPPKALTAKAHSSTS